MAKKTSLVWFLLLIFSFTEMYRCASEPAPPPPPPPAPTQMSNASGCPRIDCEAESIQTSPVLYHQVMTPLWIKNHASYLEPTIKVCSEWLRFRAAALRMCPVLFKVPLIQAGLVTDTTPLTAEVTLAVDKKIGAAQDSDIVTLLCDGDDSCYGIEAVDKDNYDGIHGTYYAPCFSSYGRVVDQEYEQVGLGPYKQKSSQYTYPAEFVFRYKLQERWVSCMASVSGGFFYSHIVPQQLKPSTGLSLVVTTSEGRDRVAIGMIKVTVSKESQGPQKMKKDF